MSAPYTEWAQRWANEMAMAQPYIEQRREAQRAVAVANRAKPKPCAVKVCKRSGGKRGICAGHWKLVPLDERIRAQIAVLEAQMREANRQHRRLAKIARTLAS